MLGLRRRGHGFEERDGGAGARATLFPSATGAARCELLSLTKAHSPVDFFNRKPNKTPASASAGVSSQAALSQRGGTHYVTGPHVTTKVGADPGKRRTIPAISMSISRTPERAGPEGEVEDVQC